MYSLNAPVPPAVARLASGLATELRDSDVRTRHSLVVKRLGNGERRSGAERKRGRGRGRGRGSTADPGGRPASDPPWCPRDDPTGQRVVDRARCALEGSTTCDAAVARLEAFENPVGRAPVVYLAVESPGLVRLHEGLCEAFEPVSGLEGDEYAPHVTIARGGDARRLLGREIDPIRWTVDRLELFDARARESVGSVALPA